VVVEASGPFTYRFEPTTNGETRVVLTGLSVKAAETQTVNDGLVKALQLATSPPTLRVSFQGHPGQTKTHTLQEPYRLVLDFYRSRGRAEPVKPSQGEPLRVIVLDAGHGGQDPGAIGQSGLQEKDVVLDVTKRLARLIEGELGVKVLLARSNDEFIPLRERTSFANSRKADLFLSIHANAHRVSASEGVESYFLSSEASDNEARQVAALENGVIELEPGNNHTNPDFLKSILWDLAQSDFQEESSRFAETVLDSLTQALRIPNRGVKQAGFYVLGGAAMPAVLVEIGFLTNRKEERKLMDPNYREKIARALFRGVAEYKQRYDQKMGVAQGREGRE
jgi:N-acetylmuramoyl-L-alanine amidase